MAETQSELRVGYNTFEHNPEMTNEETGSVTISVQMKERTKNSHSLILLFSEGKESNIFLWYNKDFNNKHNQPCAWGNIQMDFLQTIELLNLLMKIYVYKWDTQIGAKIPFSW